MRKYVLFNKVKRLETNETLGPAPRGFAVAWARESGAPEPGPAAEAMVAVADARREGGILRTQSANGAIAVQQLLGYRPARQIVSIEHADLVVSADCRLMHTKELAARLGLEPSANDIALVAAAYRRWGPDLGAELDGDYAIAIWDGGRGQMVLLRDPFAMRPLFMAFHKGLFLAASEIRMLHAAGVPAEVDELRLALQICSQYAPSSHTYWLGTTALDQAETKIVTEHTERSFTHWSPQIGKPFATTNELDALEGLCEVITTATAQRVDAGRTALSLSGGVDSTNVALAAPHGSLLTLTWAYDQYERSDEHDVTLPISHHIGAKALPVPVGNLVPYGRLISSELGPLATYDAAFEWVPAVGGPSQLTMRTARGKNCHTLIIAHRGDEIIGDGVWDLTGLLFSGRIGRFIDEMRAMAAGQGLRRFLGELYCRLIAEPALLRLGPRASELALRLPYGPKPWFTPPDHLPKKWHTRELIDIVYGAETGPLPGEASPPLGAILRWRRLRSSAAAALAEIYERQGVAAGVEFTDPWADRRVAEFILKIPQWAVGSPRRPKKLAQILATSRGPNRVSPLVEYIPQQLTEILKSDRSNAAVREMANLEELAARDLCDPAVIKKRGGKVEQWGATTH